MKISGSCLNSAFKSALIFPNLSSLIAHFSVGNFMKRHFKLAIKKNNNDPTDVTYSILKRLQNFFRRSKLD